MKKEKDACTEQEADKLILKHNNSYKHNNQNKSMKSRIEERVEYQVPIGKNFVCFIYEKKEGSENLSLYAEPSLRTKEYKKRMGKASFPTLCFEAGNTGLLVEAGELEELLGESTLKKLLAI